MQRRIPYRFGNQSFDGTGSRLPWHGTGRAVAISACGSIGCGQALSEPPVEPVP